MERRRDRGGRILVSVPTAVLAAAAWAYVGCSGGTAVEATVMGEGGTSSGGGHGLGTSLARTAGTEGARPATSPNDISIAVDTTRSSRNDAGSTDATLPGVQDAGGTDATLPGARDAADDDSEVGDAALTVDCSPDAGGSIGASGAPGLLACTGLYSDWASGTIAPSALAYDPGLHLWSDGAVKRRFISLPPGTQIDTSDMDEWTFPIGTKVWKEFTLNGQKIETRYLHKLGDSEWAWTTYQWSVDQTSATELTTGATNVNGTGYEIPYLDECRTCHMGRLDFVLGFEAIGLSTPLATGLTMAELLANDCITDPPSAPLVIPGDATSSAALGWLHANCGTACHNPSNYALAMPTGFFMRLEAANLASVQTTDTYTTGVNVISTFQPTDAGTMMRIAPGNPADSCVIFRDGYRNTHGEGIQMPPIDTHVVDTADVATVTSWITSL
jgi:hypothetical protein